MPIRAQEGVEPQLLFTALQLADHVRYAVALVRPLSTTATNVRVDVSLPAGAELTETLQTPNRSVFLRVDGNVLSWGAPSYEPGDAVDAFTFRLARPLSGEARIRASWEIDGQERVHEILEAPEVELAAAAAGEAILRSGLEAALIGETGVHVSVDPEAGLDGVTLRVRKLGADANPPAGVGSPWWCAMLTVEGLPDGVGVFAIVPLRQPLPPDARVDLFVERGGAWERLEDQGYATTDGQFVAFHHPGGTVAAGVSTTLQPAAVAQPPLGGVLQPPARPRLPVPPRLRVSILGPSQIPLGPLGTAIVHSIKVDNVGTSTQPVNVTIFGMRLGGPPLGLRLSSPFGLSGGFECQLRQFSLDDFAECNTPALVAGSSGTILLGSVKSGEDGGRLKVMAVWSPRPPGTDASLAEALLVIRSSSGALPSP